MHDNILQLKLCFWLSKYYVRREQSVLQLTIETLSYNMREITIFSSPLSVTPYKGERDVECSRERRWL